MKSCEFPTEPMMIYSNPRQPNTRYVVDVLAFVLIPSGAFHDPDCDRKNCHEIDNALYDAKAEVIRQWMEGR